MVGKTDGAADPAEVTAALVDLAEWLARVRGEEGWLAALRFGVAGALAQTEQTALAMRGYREILSENPAHLWAWVGVIDLALKAQDAQEAASLGRAAMAALPDVPILRRKATEAIERAEGPDAAIACLDPIAQPPQTPTDLAYAITLFRSAQRVSETKALSDALLAHSPDDALAHLARIEMWLAHDDDDAALAAAREARERHLDHPEIRLRAAQVMLRHGLSADAASLIVPIPDEPILANAFRALAVSLAPTMPQHGGRDDAVAAIDAACDAALGAAPHGPETASLIATLAVHVDLPWYRALGLVARAHKAERVDLCDKLTAIFDAAAWSTTDRIAFDVESRLLRDGPICALARLRQAPVAARDAEAAERLGRVLLQAGRAKRAARYLAFCIRRWPEDGALIALGCRASLAAGSPHRIEQFLTRKGEPLPPGRIMQLRITAAMAMGRDDLARALALSVGDGDPIDPPLSTIMAVHLLHGDLAAAETCLSRISGTEGPLEAALIQRPRATKLGTLLNEARILAATGQDAVDATSEGMRAGDFFILARDRIATSPDMLPHAAARSPAVGEVHLIWSEIGPETDDGKRLATIWANRTGRKVNAISLDQGHEWLAAEIGPRAARAYRMTRDPAQRADLLLYARLARLGGIGLGLPQWPARAIGSWLDAIGPTRLFRDAWGAPDTAMILALPDDPVMATACEMAVEACLARENDHRWFKTGPGLLARALARQPEIDRHPLSPRHMLRRYAHPFGAATD